MTSRSPFTTVRSVGGLLPVDLLNRLTQSPDSLPGTAPGDYHLPDGWRLRDAINHSFTELQGAWTTFQAELAGLGGGERATTVTRERWLLPLFAELGYGRLARSPALSLDGHEYPVSHMWGQVPIHLLGADIDLDRRTKGVAGAAAASPHSMVQDLLNRSDAHLWAIVSNGRTLRLLRDNTSLTRASYLEFDIADMFAGQVFADFSLLWMLCHQSRFEAERPGDCWEETWVEESKRQGVRALDHLRSGFEAAITILGAGFLAHPANTVLRDRLRDGDLTTDDYHRQVLRLVYRLVFLLVAEDRDLLHPPGTPDTAKDLYARYYSLDRLRDRARRHRGTRHSDLWESLKPLFAALDKRGLPAAGVPALGSFLWSPDACNDIDHAHLSNRDLLAAVRQLAYTERDRALHRVDFANLGPEELGSVYESLLELHPRVDTAAARFELVAAGGSERKTTGSYYTPTSLITSLLDTALDPVLDRAANAADPEVALLSLTVLDPACGSGHFLIAAAQRIATRLATHRTGETSPPPPEVRAALRQVISHCIHGIDANPMAVELCKVNLWVEAVEPGRPLNFLDNHIVCGNTLLGATPALLADGIPDSAFKDLTGDDKATVTALRKTNQLERAGHHSLFTYDLGDLLDPLAHGAAGIDTLEDDTLTEVEAKAAAWAELIGSDRYRAAVFAADMWCAAFVAPKAPGEPAITDAAYQNAIAHPDHTPESLRRAVEDCAAEFRFLHPHLAFPAVYGAGGPGGFDVVLGNPPWEKVKLSEKEFFAVRAPEVAAAAGARRKALINKLRSEDPDLWDDYQAALRHAEGESHFLRSSGRYPLCGKGDVNTYAVFAEAMRDDISEAGRVGVIVPTGIATDDTTKDFFSDCVTTRSLVSLYDFENAVGMFEGVGHGRFKFSLLTLTGLSAPVDAAEFAFFAHRPEDLSDPERRFTLTPEDLSLINPNTRTAPIFRTRRDAEITKKVYRQIPVLLREDDPNGNPWGIKYQRMFDMTNDSHLFRTADELTAEGARSIGNVWVRGAERWLPLYEAKMAHHFTHRWGDFTMKASDHLGSNLPDIPAERLDDPTYVVQPRYWVAEPEVRAALKDESVNWLLGFRNVTNATNERTMVATALPMAAIGNSEPLLNPAHLTGALLATILSSFAHDYCARQKLGGTNMNFFVAEQLPVLPPTTLDQAAPWSLAKTVAGWIGPRVLELTYTAWDLAGFATDLGYHGPPFHWIPDRRRLLRAELDAAFFHLYGYDRDDVDYVMDTFPIVARDDEKAHGEYLTKRLILERYDALAKATESGEPYRTVLDPPPADPSVAHTEHV